MEIYTKPVERRNFSRIRKVIELPDLVEVQRKSYLDFLQMEKGEHERLNEGLEEVFQEMFPIHDFNETSVLEYISYSFEQPKYTPREALDRSTMYAAPLKIKVRLVTYEIDEETKEKAVISAKESNVYLCDIPLMTDRGTFIINGVERVIVSQLHRSPGIFFEDLTSSKSIIDKHLFSARIIPYRGSWIDFEYDTKNMMYVRIDKKRKILVTVLLKALGLSVRDILGLYYDIETLRVVDSNTFIKPFVSERMIGLRIAANIEDANGEVLVRAGNKITKAAARRIDKAGVTEMRVLFDDIKDTYIAEDVVSAEGELLASINAPIDEELLESFVESGIKEFQVLFIDKNIADSAIRDILSVDKIQSTDEALIEIYKRLRPGEPATIEMSKLLFENLFFNSKRYDLSRVGRLKINKRLKLDKSLDMTTLVKEDIIETVRVLENIRKGLDRIDDIDHLGHRRVRGVGEQLKNHIRIGLARMEKTVKERMSLHDIETHTPQDLLNAKPLSSSIKEYFSGQMSQFMDQTNPLSEITHKRRLSALGPGGLNRDRAGFEVRDVHTSHYGRICPIETPEGPNIGLISSLTTYARINEFGFVETPYRKVKDCFVTDEVVYMSAIEEEEFYIAQANALLDDNNYFMRDAIAARHGGEAIITPKSNIQYMDVAPMQMVSASTALIPFLEHDDANRALMGSNMQRQAVPLINTESPVVGTGMERKVAVDSGAVITAGEDCVVDYVDASKIIVRYQDGTNHVQVVDLVKYKRSNQDTCINYKPLVVVGQQLKKGDTLADGPATDRGELALGKNVTVAFMPWMGYNYEDSILVSKRLVKDDVFTSIHVEVFEIGARDTKLGPEELTRDIPNVSAEALKDLDESGIVRIGAKVAPGDIIVGKVTPKGETQVTPEEKLLRAIFGEKAGVVKDASLRIPPEIWGTVVDVQVMTRRGIEKDDRTIGIENSEYDKLLSHYELVKESLDSSRKHSVVKLFASHELAEAYELNGKSYDDIASMPEDELLELDFQKLSTVPVKDIERLNREVRLISEEYFKHLESAEEEYRTRRKKVEKGDELPAGVLKLVKVFVAIKRRLSVGDKMAGRHGNKGVVSCILPEQDMPYLPTGEPVDIVLNPLGVPSRMNVGQILEIHLGWAAKALNLHVATEVFDGAKESDIKELLEQAGYKTNGQTALFDGRSGEAFHQEVTVGTMYMLKLHHLVDTKIHARSTGPYSLVTQQPLGGKAQFGGQRLGEMEVWALEAYGAANILREMLTVKSDDVEGRTKVYESIVNGNYNFKPSMPESFNVLIKELQGLVLDVELLKANDVDELKEDAEFEAEEV